VRALAAVAAVLAAAAGCGGGSQPWPDCLRILGAAHVRVATSHELAHGPKLFAARRAAAVAFRDGTVATIVVSRTEQAAATAAHALASGPSIVNMPGPETPLQPSAVRRRRTTVLQWFGKRDRRRENTLLECAAR
jgi:hypothetical protein